jgi:serine/threonine-protein kinase 11
MTDLILPDISDPLNVQSFPHSILPSDRTSPTQKARRTKFFMLVSKTLWKFTPISHDLPSKPRPLKQINHYLLRQKIGSGGSSQVYLGVDQRSGEFYAIKRIKLVELIRSSTGLAQLEREIRLMRIISHPNILRLIEILHVKSNDEVYLVLEYAEKGSVGAFLERGIKLSLASIFSILKQIITALKYLHNAGYIHQDIKPFNILVAGDGRAMLADFGVGHSFASAGMVVGSPAYQAPEALDDSYGTGENLDEPQKEDVWALGVTLYQLLFGELPFLGATLFEIVNNIRRSPLKIPEKTDPDVEELLRGMLTVDPVRRFGIDDLIRKPLIRDADERARDLPEGPVMQFKEGPILELFGDVCGEDYSFADIGLAARRRGSYAAGRRAMAIKVIEEEASNRRSSYGVEQTAHWVGPG